MPNSKVPLYIVQQNIIYRGESLSRELRAVHGSGLTCHRQVIQYRPVRPLQIQIPRGVALARTTRSVRVGSDVPPAHHSLPTRSTPSIDLPKKKGRFSLPFFFGGPEGSRTPVRKSIHIAFFGWSLLQILPKASATNKGGIRQPFYPRPLKGRTGGSRSPLCYARAEAVVLIGRTRRT